MRLYKKLQKKLGYLKQNQIEQINQAFDIAYSAHAGQKRDSGEEYISHPVAVADILADMHMDPESIVAAILHDVIEDTSVSKDIIVQKFGKTVADLVDGVTKLNKLQFTSSLEAQAESFRKMILAMSRDIRVILIKLADRLHNMRTIASLPPHRRRRIAKETLDIYAPIANRIGMHDLYIELENLSFAAYYPVRYKVLTESIRKARGNRKEIISTIDKDLKKYFAKSSLPDVAILGREKHLYSIYKKMIKKHLAFSDIMDVYAFRIIVDSINDCYLALGIVHGLYKPMPGQFEDYIAIPKINGYQSLHTTLFGPHGVPIEVQIRTKKMDQTANKGIAAHWLYKLEDQMDESHMRAQQWINDLLEMQQRIGTSMEFVEHVKIDLFPDEIYVFTPQGKIIKLPYGATPVDFAYAVHTDVGNTCVLARINRQLAPLSTELKSGQTVSIVTRPAARPDPVWLSFVKTAKARSSIRHFLRNRKKTEVVALGKELLKEALASKSLSLKKISKEMINELLQFAKLENIEELYEDIGLGNRVALFVAYQLAESGKPKEAIEAKAIEGTGKPLLIEGTEGLAVSFASCCRPIPGDNIIGCFSKDRGLIIHTDHCEKISKLREQFGKCVLAKWSEHVSGEFIAKVKVEMASKRGTLAILSKAISDAEVNIEDININERIGEHYLVTLRLFVRNRDHLNQVLRRIENLQVVTQAYRIQE